MATLVVPEHRQSVQSKSRLAKTILVVEDETFVREVTCEVLKQCGYRVLPAESAGTAKALFCCYQEQIDLLLCDAMLPDEDGISLARALREISPRLEVIFASGYPPAELDPQFLEQSEEHYLTKPFSAETLMSKVREVLAQKALAMTSAQS